MALDRAAGRATGGEPTRSEESSEVRWIPRKDLGGYAMDRSMRLRIGHYLEGRATPYLSQLLQRHYCSVQSTGYLVSE